MAQTGHTHSHRFFAALFIGIILAICLFTGLASLGLTGPDEPRYAWIAQHMASTGDWLTPRLYGHPWFEKPILYYWSAALAFKFIPSAEWAVRLPSAFAALIAVLSAGALAFWRYGRRTARATLLIFSTSVGVIAFARAAGPDMLFTASLALALFSAVSILEKNSAFPVDALRRKPDDRFDLALLGIWLGLATLAKGPAALILAGGSVLLWAVSTGNLRRAVRMLHPIAILFFAIVAVPWYALCAHANPGFIHVFFIEHNFQRYLTPLFQHRQPFWFFAPIVLLGFLPWSALLLSVGCDAFRIFRDRSWRSSPGFFIACWAISPFVFFSFSQSKLPEYILPIFPPLAILLAHSFIYAVDHAPRRSQWIGVATGAMWVLLGVAGAIGFHRLPAYAPFLHEEISRLALASLLIGIAAGFVIELLSLWRKFWFVLAFSAIISASVVLAAGISILPRLDPLLSARPLARDIHSTLSESSPLYSVGEINRDCDYGLRFYLEHDSFPPLNLPVTSETYVLLSRGGDMQLNDMGIIRRKIVARFFPYCWVELVEPKSSP